MKSIDRLGEKVQFTEEDENIFEMVILNEFSHKEKNYAILMEEESCEDDCDCCDKNMVILESKKDKDGKETFESIKDEKLFKEIVDKAEQVIFEE